MLIKTPTGMYLALQSLDQERWKPSLLGGHQPGNQISIMVHSLEPIYGRLTYVMEGNRRRSLQLRLRGATHPPRTLVAHGEKTMMPLTPLTYGPDHRHRSSGPPALRSTHRGNGACQRRMTGTRGENLTGLSIRVLTRIARATLASKALTHATTCVEEYLGASTETCGASTTSTRPVRTK